LLLVALALLTAACERPVQLEYRRVAVPQVDLAGAVMGTSSEIECDDRIELEVIRPGTGKQTVEACREPDLVLHASDLQSTEIVEWAVATAPKVHYFSVFGIPTDQAVEKLREFRSIGLMTPMAATIGERPSVIGFPGGWLKRVELALAGTREEAEGLSQELGLPSRFVEFNEQALEQGLRELERGRAAGSPSPTGAEPPLTDVD